MPKITRPKLKKVLQVYLTEQDYASVTSSAAQAGMPMSRFARNCCLGIRMQHIMDAKAVRDLLGVNADLGRLGGLFKMAISKPDVPREEIRGLLEEIRQTKDVLEQKILDM